MRPSSLIALALCALSAPAAAQSTWYVDASNTPPGDGSQANPYASLQFCLGQPTTVDGDTVLVLPGTYVEDLDLLGKSLDVRSTAGAAQTVLRPAVARSVVTVIGAAAARLEGFTIRDGQGTSDGARTRGGGVLCAGGALELDSCVLTGSQAALGGNLCVQGGASVTLRACALEEGDAYQGGGAYVEASDLLAVDTAFSSNADTPAAAGPGLPHRGIGLCSDAGATIELHGCALDGNRPATSGGAFEGAGLYHGGGGSALLVGCAITNNGGLGAASSFGGGVRSATPVELRECVLAGNDALNLGGGLYGLGTLRRCELRGNRAFSGGGTYGFALTIEDSLLVENRNVSVEGPCTGSGGGAYGGTLSRCELRGNVTRQQGAGAWGAMLVECLVVDNVVEAGNACADDAGGAGLWGGSATDCQILGNRVVLVAAPFQAMVGGGAAQATLLGCVLAENLVDGGDTPFWPRRGGGAQACVLADCTVRENVCRGAGGLGAPRGGGVEGGTATDCTLVGNRAEQTGAGEPLAVGGGAAGAQLSRCVLVGNVAARGGAAWSCDLSRCSASGNLALVAGGGLSLHPGPTGGAWGSATVTDSILWGDAPGELEVGSGTLVATWSDVEGGWPGVGNLDADPLFWSALAGDLHLRAGSPCIDAGDPSAPPDPDGSPRDMGALPFDAGYVGGPYVYCEAKVTSEGCLPAIASSGAPTLSGPDDFVLEASALTGQQTGVMFWGLGPDAAPFMGGLRCVALPVVRTPVTATGGSAAPCSGTLSFPFTQAYALASGLSAGDRVFAQFWFRDPAQPDGTGVGLSDALDFTLLP